MKPIAVILTAVFAFGVGVTGTLLWSESRPRPVPLMPIPTIASNSIPNIPQSSESSPLVRSGDNAQTNSQDESHKPPAELTNSMSPSKGALTLGDWYYDHEQWELAISNYQKAIHGGVDDPNIRTDLGNALRFNNRHQEALKQYQLAQKQDPTHEQSLFNQGSLYAFSLKDSRKGIEIWNAYLKRFPAGGNVSQARELIVRFGSTG